MDDGSLKIEFKDGEITGVYVNADLNFIYKKIFDNSLRNIKRKPNDVIHGIKVIVFGCFLLEASSNKYLKDFLSKIVSKNTHREIFWEKLKRDRILDKLKIISSFANQNELQIFNEYRGDLKKIFDLRNRLAHFKDKDTKIFGPIKLEELFNEFPSISEPELMQELKGQKNQHHGTIILKVNSWLKAVHKRNFKNMSVKEYKI